MAVTQRGSANIGPTSSASLTLTLTKPTGVVSGDLLMAVVTSIGSGSTSTGPSGWTEVDTATSAGGMKMSLWAKIAGGSEGASYVWTETALGSQRWVGTITAWSGVKNTSVTTAIGTNSNFTSNQTTTAAQATASVTTSATVGRTFYARSGRVASDTPRTYTEASATASEVTDTGNNGALSGISYSHIFAMDDADFSGSGSKAGLTTTASGTVTDNVFATWTVEAAPEGSFAATLGQVSMDFAGDVPLVYGPVAIQLGNATMDFAGSNINEGVIGMTLGNVTEAFAGTADGTGTFSMQLSPITADFAGQIINGSFAMQLGNVTGVFDGAVNPIGDFSLSLSSVTMQFGSETTPFGEHVIHIQPERRSFQVIDDDPGIVSIYSDQVTDA